MKVSTKICTHALHKRSRNWEIAWALTIQKSMQDLFQEDQGGLCHPPSIPSTPFSPHCPPPPPTLSNPFLWVAPLLKANFQKLEKNPINMVCNSICQPVTCGLDVCTQSYPIQESGAAKPPLGRMSYNSTIHSSQWTMDCNLHWQLHCS